MAYDGPGFNWRLHRYRGPAHDQVYIFVAPSEKQTFAQVGRLMMTGAEADDFVNMAVDGGAKLTVDERRT